MEKSRTVRELAKDRPHNMLIVCWDTNNKIGVIPPLQTRRGKACGNACGRAPRPP